MRCRAWPPHATRDLERTERLEEHWHPRIPPGAKVPRGPVRRSELCSTLALHALEVDETLARRDVQRRRSFELSALVWARRSRCRRRRRDGWQHERVEL